MGPAQGPDSADETPASRLYREVHRWPCLFGAPAHIAMGLLLGGFLGTSLAGLVGGDALVASVVLGTVALWVLARAATTLDEARLPLVLLKLRIVWRTSLTSYSPSRTRIVIEDEAAPPRGAP